MKIFAYSMRPYDELPAFEALQKQLGFEFAWTEEYPSPENVHLAEGADGVSIITNPTPASMLDLYRSAGVRFLSTRSIGYDHIDVAHARKLGMRVSHVTYSPNSVANYTIMLMLMACRKIGTIVESGKRQDFSLLGKMGRELSLSTVGVIGTGRIGETVIRHLAGFGCRILAYDLYPKTSLEGLCEYADLDTLYGACDIITVHVPGSAHTRHMFDAEAFAKMKPGAIFINCARGMLVDTAALLDAADSGRIAYAMLDTFEAETGMYYHNFEGRDLDNPEWAALQAAPNILLAPHMAFYTEQAVADMVANSVRGLLAFGEGKETPLEVDYEG
ncbi:MAG: lactate dehydrogenase [Oscillospiraceae bacterium]|nr:lactate dehydrogenase [Oscillospiraceae bacterium]